MTNKELIEILSTFPEDIGVYCVADALVCQIEDIKEYDGKLLILDSKNGYKF